MLLDVFWMSFDYAAWLCFTLRHVCLMSFDLAGGCTVTLPDCDSCCLIVLHAA
jgi:hypothetical protein